MTQIIITIFETEKAKRTELSSFSVLPAIQTIKAQILPLSSLFFPQRISPLIADLEW